MATWYRVGSVTVTQGSKVVTGVDTLWESQVKIGDAFTRDGNRIYEIESVDSNTQLTLRNTYQETSESAVDYAILRNFTSTLPAQLAASLASFLNRVHQREDEYHAWQSGTVDGGPQSDGRYPITDALGQEMLIASPAKLEAMATSEVDDLRADLKTAAYADILGTVSQSGGIPTGAIIESGSNSDGYYVILADGTMIQWFESATEVVTDNAVGNIFRNGTNLVLSYPRQFADEPRQVVPIARYSGNGTGFPWAVLVTKLLASTTLRVQGPAVNTGAFVGYVAIGRRW